MVELQLSQGTFLATVILVNNSGTSKNYRLLQICLCPGTVDLCSHNFDPAKLTTKVISHYVHDTLTHTGSMISTADSSWVLLLGQDERIGIQGTE